MVHIEIRNITKCIHYVYMYNVVGRF